MFLFHFSVVCGEVSAPPLAVRWGHLHLSGRGPVPAVGQQHQRTACNYQYDLKPTRVHSAHSWLLQNNRARLLSLSQQTQKPAGLHQPLRWEEEGQTHLWAKGRTAVCTGWYPHARHWFVLPEPLPVLFFFFCGCIVAALINIVAVVIVTEYANHARDHLKTEAELKNCDGWGSILSWYYNPGHTDQVTSSRVDSRAGWCVSEETECSVRSSMVWSGEHR